MTARHRVFNSQLDGFGICCWAHPTLHFREDRFHATSNPGGEVPSKTMVEAGDLEQARRFSIGPPVN
jgi:hypothetical protein